MLHLRILSATALVTISPVLAQLPYNPTRLILSPDQSKVYQFTAKASQPIFSYFDLSKQIYPSTAPIVLNQDLHFLSSDQAFLPVADDKGISLVFGVCQDTTSDAQIWRYTSDKDGKNGTWSDLHLDSSETSLEANYLSAGFSFSPDGSIDDTSLYVFGGMCPDGTSNTNNWTSQATYSNTMYSVSATDQSKYQLSVTGTRSPPIAEAGLSITTLSLASSNSSSGKVSQQQNFVLLGGHTETAFINMSQIALFSLPEASWAFIDVQQPSGSTGELVRRDATIVEPRSGHTAILTEDGSQIVIFGGWVGNITNPALPQLAILELGPGYGGNTWQWTIPKQSDIPLSAQGIYGHGAVMLPGGTMFISGGTPIGSTKQKRSVRTNLFYDVAAGVWTTTYHTPTSNTANGLDTSQKVGIGAGLGLGLTALIVIGVVWWMYRIRIREKKAERERHLRELAFGSERYMSNSRIVSRTGSRFGGCDVRSTSWGSRQEQHTDSGFVLPWSGSQTQDEWHKETDGPNGVERTGTEVPSPTRGLRKSLSTRGPPTYGIHPVPMRGPGSVFRIDEAEEENSIKSPRVDGSTGNRMSDPFKDPIDINVVTPAEERKKEVQGWIEDWQSAAASLNLSRNPSQSRTYSNLSQAHSSSGESSVYKSGRESPTKSDRTGSNLSERSVFTMPKSGTVSRQMSQRSQSAGYTLFSTAAAAMAKIGVTREPALERTASKRSISLNTATRPRSRDAQSLLEDYSPTKSSGEISPIKDYKNYNRTDSLTSQRRRTNILGSVKRVLTGTGNVDVHAQVEQYEEKVEPISPTKTEPEMSEINDASTTFWQGKRGAKDWNDESSSQPQHPPSSMANNKRRSTSNTTSMLGEYDGEDWDVETAVQQRVVQVMFTVPKEKLRVVNADALSLISRSDLDEKEHLDRSGDVSRMSSLRDDRAVNTDQKGKRRDLR